MGRRLVPAVINLTNYAIGATLMTIPYTFCECGLALALLLAGAIAALTVLASEMLLQAGLSQRRASYESLSMACFGSVGKAFLEFNMVGMMYGSLIAYVIILGDLGSEILHEQLGLPMNQLLRPLVLVLFGLLLIMPLSLKKNIDKLANASALSLLFYAILTIHGPTSPDIPDSDTIPDKQFNRITFGVIISSFVLGFLMNNIEVVLNLTGSLSGSVILFIFPALVSIKSKTMTKRRWVANFLLVFGVAILGLSFLNFWSNQTLPADTAPPAIITSSSAAVAAGAPQVQRPSNHTVLKQ